MPNLQWHGMRFLLCTQPDLSLAPVIFTIHLHHPPAPASGITLPTWRVLVAQGEVKCSHCQGTGYRAGWLEPGCPVDL